MRSDREILKLANENIKELTNEEFDRYNELIKMPITERYGTGKMAMGGKACRGRSAMGSMEKA
jgi:hypothetical protein|tara:strand:- start:247 stop:435 length:189 start_codon:yes stop_codon:yes gene_type:complete